MSEKTKIITDPFGIEARSGDGVQNIYLERHFIVLLAGHDSDEYRVFDAEMELVAVCPTRLLADVVCAALEKFE